MEALNKGLFVGGAAPIIIIEGITLEEEEEEEGDLGGGIIAPSFMPMFMFKFMLMDERGGNDIL